MAVTTITLKRVFADGTRDTETQDMPDGATLGDIIKANGFNLLKDADGVVYEDMDVRLDTLVGRTVTITDWTDETMAQYPTTMTRQGEILCDSLLWRGADGSLSPEKRAELAQLYEETKLLCIVMVRKIAAATYNSGVTAVGEYLRRRAADPALPVSQRAYASCLHDEHKRICVEMAREIATNQ